MMIELTSDRLLQRAREIMPELHIEHFAREREGLVNDVIIINNSLVFRFARQEEYAQLLQVEVKILGLLDSRLGIAVPTPIYTSADCIVYPLVCGQPLTRGVLLGCDESRQYELAAQLGRFLHRLHNTDTRHVSGEIPATRAPVSRPDWLALQERVREQIYPLLQTYQIEWAEELFASVLDEPSASAYQPALIHGNLASNHILIDEQLDKITGVIDFGMAGMGDPASDFGSLISIYGETFVRKIHTTYPRLGQLLPRARFYAQLLELEWVLRGFETGDCFWFTAHLGNARDIFKTPAPLKQAGV